jgi:drug/metabolite transporter (DMT)-like permease
MRRILLEHLPFFLLPFIVYGVYLLLLRLYPPGPARAHPWAWLTIAGLLLFGGSYVLWGFESRDSTSGTYVAPHMENGQIVPGYVRPPEKKP